MKNKFSNFFYKNESNIQIAYVLIFLTALSFTFFFRKGIEFTRYGLIFLTISILYFKKEYFKKLSKDHIFLNLFLFLIISAVSLMYNNVSLGEIDDAVNWILWYIFGFLVFCILKKNAILILFLIPIFLFLFQILYPLFTGTLIDNLNFISGKRLDLFFGGKPIQLGIFAGISTFTGLCIFLRSENRYIKITYFILAFASFLVLLATGARTSFVGTTVSIAIMLICFFYKKIRLSYLVIGMFSILIVASFFLLNEKEARIFSVTNPKEVHDSFLERELIFIIARDSFFRSPVIGEGFDRFSKIYKNNLEKYSMGENAEDKYAYILPSTNNAHNFSLHFLAETGVCGFLCMNAFWMLIIINGLKSRSDIAKIISGIYLLSYIAFQFNMSLYGNQMSTLLFSLAGLSGAALQASIDSKINLDDKNF